VVLVEAGPRILASFTERMSQRAKEQLEELGVEVRTGTAVSDLGADFVEIGSERIETHTIVWAAGVRASPLTAHLGVPIDRAGRVWVEEDLSVPDRPEVFVVGDLIAKTQGGKPLPGVAPLAMQSGQHVAKNIALSMAGKTREPFRYVDKGSMATIGRNRAVAQIGKLQFSGFLAWWAWLLVHLLSLVEFKSRLSVLMEWAWAYLTWQRRSRVILELPREQVLARRQELSGARKVPDPATNAA
jgi:NADH dehydrogenase